ncbi:uncharacterized protein LOC126910695 [Spodoptera frugiperda]|uniref:Uncharacterized protein LOC126910695 n=1 Tax=Spodoptera frugiperda TaxID=7108 RepID=A0A9R0DMX0_SPOFR|nr:uncharacterized protein LOC126910695 [Spodoptera frugiperda]
MAESRTNESIFCKDGVFMDISKFSGDEGDTYSSTKWAQDIEDNAEIFGWTPQQKLIIARRSLTGTAHLWLKTEKVHRSYEELKAALLKEFPDTINSKEMHELMAARRKRKDETYYQYMLTMKEMGKRAKFPDYVAIQYIIDGISDYEANKAILYGVTTYPTLKEKLVLYENMKKKMKVKVTEKAEKHSTSTRQRCYNCGVHGHLSNSCENGIKCFKCNSFGHLSTKCTATSATTKHSENFGSRSSRPISSEIDRQRCQHDGGRSVRKPANPITSKSAMFTMDSISPVGTTDGDDENDGCQCNQNKEIMQIVNKPDKKLSKPILDIFIKNIEGKALVDSGSDVNLMSEEFYDVIGQPKTTEDGVVLSGLGLTQVHSFGKFTTCAIIDQRCYEGITFYVVPKDCMPYSIVLGHEFLTRVTMIMNEGSVLLLPSGDEWMRRINGFTVGMSVVIRSTVSPAVKKEVLQLVEDYKPNPVKVTEEDEGEAAEYRGKPKSTPDLLEDPKLSSKTTAELELEEQKPLPKLIEEEKEDKEKETAATVSNIRAKLNSKKRGKAPEGDSKRQKTDDKRTKKTDDKRSKKTEDKRSKKKKEKKEKQALDGDSQIKEYIGKEENDARQKEKERIQSEIKQRQKEIDGNNQKIYQQARRRRKRKYRGGRFKTNKKKVDFVVS